MRQSSYSGTYTTRKAALLSAVILLFPNLLRLLPCTTRGTALAVSSRATFESSSNQRPCPWFKYSKSFASHPWWFGATETIVGTVIKQRRQKRVATAQFQMKPRRFEPIHRSVKLEVLLVSISHQSAEVEHPRLQGGRVSGQPLVFWSSYALLDLMDNL